MIVDSDSTKVVVCELNVEVAFARFLNSLQDFHALSSDFGTCKHAET
jgi:hypothetical protein